MNFFKWLKRGTSVHDVVLSLYKRGLASAMKHDQQGAKEAYTTAIDMRDAPGDLRAMALYNRALLYAAANQIPEAIQDLNAVLAMTAPLHKVKSAARQKLDRMQRRDHLNTASRFHAQASS
jgi:tetratricopeptide (TPR) repeat protein